MLYGLDLQGHQICSTQVGAPIPVPDEYNAVLRTGLGAGDGLLVVPAGSILVAYARPSQSLNISTRGPVITGDVVLIGGFIITGNASKNVIIRAIGPSLPVSLGPLIDPTMELHPSDGTVITNDNWKVDDASGQSQENEVTATQLAPTDDRESAIVALLPPGSYTAIVRGKNGATGVGLVEVYDLALDGSVLGNISTRGYVDTADNVMIGGFILGPDDGPSSRIAIRALGPSLGLSGALSDPELDVRDSNGDSIATNDNWADDSSQADLVTQQLDPADPSESALIRTLPPGAYTVIVDGHEGSAGIGLVEVYNIGGD